MKRRFNINGSCKPKWHYMVDIGDRLKKIKEDYVDYGSYFVINRGRQYGKTTTLQSLANYLSEDYFVFSLDFQEMLDEKFETGETFSLALIDMMRDALQYEEGEEQEKMGRMLSEFMMGNPRVGMDDLFRLMSDMCRKNPRPIVLIIDEVDSAGNNEVFVKFLALLRGAYLNRDKRPIFHSVILAGVYDIKNLKLKIRPDDQHQYNSPWNIAAKFNLNMSFSVEQIAGMLQEYETDNHIGMDIQSVAQEIYQYTSGYPYLVSVICKLLDEEVPDRKGFEDLADVWTKEGVAEAVKMLLNENTPLFDSMIKQMDTYKEMRNITEQILYQGKRILFSPAEKYINLGLMFGFFNNENGRVVVSNRIFEMYLLNMFIAEESINSDVFRQGQSDSPQFVKNKRLDMELILQKFVEYFHEIYGDNDQKFVENYGRKFFLLYLKPIINGTGNYYMEAQTRDARRTDLIVDYCGEQFIVELKIWHGNEYNERGEQQLTEYLDYFQQKKGYLLSFNFNQKKETGVRVITLGDKTIVEAVV